MCTLLRSVQLLRYQCYEHNYGLLVHALTYALTQMFAGNKIKVLNNVQSLGQHLLELHAAKNQIAAADLIGLGRLVFLDLADNRCMHGSCILCAPFSCVRFSGPCAAAQTHALTTNAYTYTCTHRQFDEFGTCPRTARAVFTFPSRPERSDCNTHREWHKRAQSRTACCLFMILCWFMFHLLPSPVYQFLCTLY